MNTTNRTNNGFYNNWREVNRTLSDKSPKSFILTINDCSLYSVFIFNSGRVCSALASNQESMPYISHILVS